MANNEIKITHFVNPHLFFFRWVRDEGKFVLFVLSESIQIVINKLNSIFLGFSEELKILEDKIENIGEKNDVSDIKSEDRITERSIRIGDVVGVFVADRNRWIRASVKGMEGQENPEWYSVWAIDYGFPLVSRASQTIKLPLSFQGMNLKNKRILTGGIEYIMPAENHYDFEMKCGVMEKTLNWSPDAIKMVQNILQLAIKLNFEQVHEYKLKNVNFFGRLMIQRADGQMVNMTKPLLEMNMATLSDCGFAEEIKTIETLRQKHWLSIDGKMLDSKLWVSPFTIPKPTKDETYTNNDFLDDETIVDSEENLPDDVDAAFFDDSVSTFKPMNTSHLTNDDDDLVNGSPKVDSTKNKVECITEKPNDNSTPNGVGNARQNDVKKRRVRRYNRGNKSANQDPTTTMHPNKKDDQNRSNNQKQNQNNRSSQQFQNHRIMLPNPRHIQPNQFNQLRSQFIPPMNIAHSPLQYNQQPGRRNDAGYASPHLQQKYQNNRNRNDHPNKFGDPEFEACIGRPQGIGKLFSRIFLTYISYYESHSCCCSLFYLTGFLNDSKFRMNQHIPLPNGLMNISPYHHPMQPFSHHGLGLIHNPNLGVKFGNNHKIQLNERRNNMHSRNASKQQNAGTENNRNKPNENNEAKSDTQSTSTVTISTEIERKTQQIDIKNEPAKVEENTDK